MPSTRKKPAAPAGKKPTREQSAILEIIQQAGYTSADLQQVMYLLAKPQLPQLCTSLRVLICSYLASTDMVQGTEVTGLWNLLTLTNDLDEIARRPAPRPTRISRRVL